MDDRLRETLSAMLDDEADELSVRRLLSHDTQQDVQEQWQRWQQVRDLMHGVRTPVESVDVSDAVREALDGRSRSVSGHLEPERRASRWQWPAVAMVAMALVIGFGAGASWDSAETVMEAPLAALEPSGHAGSESVQEVRLQQLDQEQLDHLGRYLLEHAQHNSVGAGRGSVGYARLVSATGNGQQ